MYAGKKLGKQSEIIRVILNPIQSSVQVIYGTTLKPKWVQYAFRCVRKLKVVGGYGLLNKILVLTLAAKNVNFLSIH